MREEIALSSILGASVYDSSGAFAGHVREVAIFPQEDPNRISDFIVKTREGDRLLPSRQIKTVIGSAIQVNGSAHDWEPLSSSEGMLLLERDLLDQQIIDVSGRKVVRVNDVDLRREQVNGTLKLKVGRVDIGLRGAIRRLLKGLAPSRAVEALAMRMPEKSIPWEAVDLIETDPTRRVRLLHEFGLDRPLAVQYADYLRHVVSGDLGTSLTTHEPVLQEFKTLFPATVELAFFALVFAVAVGLPHERPMLASAGMEVSSSAL